MRSILVLGAGRSSSALIDYLLEQSATKDWEVTVGDVSHPAATERVGNSDRGKAVAFDIQQESSTIIMEKCDIVISLLPASLHPMVARKCLALKKHLLTASYVSEEMKSFDAAARQQGLLFLNECGLDPGIDHMSAMQVIDRIKREGGELQSFESFTGGLIAPETDPQNPWRYKFTWNPGNVVMAGQGTAKYLRDGQFKYIPYQQLFKRITPVTVPGYGEYEGYANRDSLKYREAYGLKKITTMLRGTLRHKGFCDAWDLFVQLGCTDDTYGMEDVLNMTHLGFIQSFFDVHSKLGAEEYLAKKFQVDINGPVLTRLRWSGLFEDTPVGLKEGSPAAILEHILNKRWKLHTGDRDMIVMWHRFRYLLNGKEKEIQASLVSLGENFVRTAMAKTVGLPLGIAARLLLEKGILSRGVIIPTGAEIYQPVLFELQEYGIKLTEKEDQL